MNLKIYKQKKGIFKFDYRVILVKIRVYIIEKEIIISKKERNNRKKLSAIVSQFQPFSTRSNESEKINKEEKSWVN